LLTVCTEPSRPDWARSVSCRFPPSQSRTSPWPWCTRTAQGSSEIQIKRSNVN